MLHALVLWADDPHNPAYHFPDKEELQTRLKESAAAHMTADLAESEVVRMASCSVLTIRQEKEEAPTYALYSSQEIL